MCLTREVVQTQAAESVIEFLLFYGRLPHLSLKFLQKSHTSHHDYCYALIKQSTSKIKILFKNKWTF